MDDDSPSPQEQRNVRNLTWDELPPKRRRFFFWLLLMVLLIGPLAGTLLEVLGVSDMWSEVLVFVLLVTVLGFLGRAAWLELQERRAKGEEPPPARVTVAGLFAWTLATLLLWGLVAYFAVSIGRPFIPMIPIFFTAVTVMRFRHWHLQRTS